MIKKRIPKTVFYVRRGDSLKCPDCLIDGHRVTEEFPIQFAYVCPACGSEYKWMISNEMHNSE